MNTLFLSEHVTQAETVTAVPFAEAALGLVELTEQMGNLNEALLIGDYALHQRTQGLNEAEQTAEKEGFFKKAAAKVKELVSRAKDTILRFYESLKARVMGIIAKIKAKARPEMKIVKGGMAAFGKLVENVNKVIDAAAGKADDAAAYQKHADEVIKAAVDSNKAILDEMRKAKGKGEFETVPVSQVTKFQTGATVAQASAQRSAKALDDAANKAAEAANVGPMTEDATKKLASARAQVAVQNRAAQVAGGVGSAISIIIAAV